MSIITKGKKSESAVPSVADLTAKIDATKAELRRLDNLQYDLAALSVTDEKVERDYQQCIADSVEAQKTLEHLQAALIGIDRREQRAAVTTRIDARHADFKELEAVVGARLRAIEEAVRGIEIATTAYTRFIAASEQLQLAVAPFGAVALPMESATSLEIVADGQPPMAVPPAAAIASEMHRQGGVLHLALPGAKAPVLQVIDRPTLIEPLAASAARQSAAILAAVREHIARTDASDAKKLEAA